MAAGCTALKIVALFLDNLRSQQKQNPPHVTSSQLDVICLKEIDGIEQKSQISASKHCDYAQIRLFLIRLFLFSRFTYSGVLCRT